LPEAAGFIGGEALFANVHGWIGYTIFVAFYSAAAFAYVKIGRPQRTLF